MKEVEFPSEILRKFRDIDLKPSKRPLEGNLPVEGDGEYLLLSPKNGSRNIYGMKMVDYNTNEMLDIEVTFDDDKTGKIKRIYGKVESF